MFLAEIRYKTENRERLSIVKVFKTMYHYLKDCKHKVFIYTNYNNIRQFIDSKKLRIRQVWWA